MVSLATSLLHEAATLSAELSKHREYLHAHAETGFALTYTLPYVKTELEKMGYVPEDCGRAGLCVLAGGCKPGKVFLLRADMDALPIPEQSGVAFAARNGCMHACGHDMHTAMLLGAASLLKQHEAEIQGTVKLMFQPAEEIFEGAADMICGGVLENPRVDAALMLHVMAGVPFVPGTIIVSDPGVSAPAADTFEVRIRGKGCHGSMPSAGIDPLTAAAHILIALQEIPARELALPDRAVLTVGAMHAGEAANVIPDTAILRGSLRTFAEEVRAAVKQRIREIATGIAGTFRAAAEVTFSGGCPPLQNDKALVADATRYGEELLGAENVFSVAQLRADREGGDISRSAGSEDFAYVSREVPSVMLALAAGQPEKGYRYPQHHPMVKFDPAALPFGSAVYAYTAMRWLKDHTE